MKILIDGVVNYVHRHERLRYVIRCMRNIGNKEFVYDVNHLYTNLNFLKLVQNGMQNKGRIIYNIDVNIGSGFFAVFNHVIEQIYYADTLGLIPYVRLGNKFPYAEEAEVNGTFNPWEYYFRQPGGLTRESVDKSYAVVANIKDPRKLEELKLKSAYIVNDQYIELLGEIFKKYIFLQDCVDKEIMYGIDAILNGKKTLGVQIRMGSMLVGWDKHPIVPSLDEYICEIKKAIDIGGFEQIYLATDDKRVLDALIKQFGSMLVYYKDVTRVEGRYNPYDVNTGREKHNYFCGLEVLRDMYTLAYTSGLVAGHSQVSICARICKSSTDKKYEYVKIVDKGINHNKRSTGGKEALELTKREIEKYKLG